MSTRIFRHDAISRVFGLLASLILLSMLGACADGGYPSGSSTQYGSSAPDLNCQFGSPCGNSRNVRP